jgi:Ca2+-transporting ATPase
MMEERTRPFHAQDIKDVLSALGVQPKEGLFHHEVKRRRREYGPNRLREVKSRSIGGILIDQFKSVVVIILALAAVLAFSFGRWSEGIAITTVIGVNGIIGLISEWRAVRSLEALRERGTRVARTRRDGREREVPVSGLVPGDVVILEGGDLVPADVRVIEANGLRADESALTGESVSVHKRPDPVNTNQPLAERSSLLFKGTTVIEGSGSGVVVATGMQTELGRISELAEQAESETTPLEQRLNRLGWRLAWATLVIAVLVAGSGLAAGQPVLPMIETAIALGVAAIPEGMPAVATIALARGMWLMSRRHALVRRLAAVETLGATRVILTDKTGTLTENEMSLHSVVTPDGDHELDLPGKRPEGRRESPGHEPNRADGACQRVLEIGVLCNNASLAASGTDDGGAEAHGDPTEIAILRAGAAFGLHREAMLADKPEVSEIAFDPDLMMMATVHEVDSGFEIAVKGAPQAVLEASTALANGADEARPMTDERRNTWVERSEGLASDGLRVLATAAKKCDAADEDPYRNLRFVGLLGLLDPPRADVRESIQACRRAGIRVVMVTGDQSKTAMAIGRQVGLVDDDCASSVVHGRELGAPDDLSRQERERILETRIFARVSPEQKLQLVQLFQESGHIVAVTGDGVNDAPALKKADIGVAMGQRGTDAAREVAEMVLEDDALTSIVVAVRQGRTIFSNIRKSVMFMLCTNVAEIIAVALASLAGAPLPLRPLQILYLNVLTDAWPALALGVNKGHGGVMDRPPRDPGESILTGSHWRAIGGWGLTIAACVLGALSLAILWRHMEPARAVTVSFLTLGFAKLLFVFNLRDRSSSLLHNEIIQNRWVWLAITLCVGLLFAAVYAPGLSETLDTRRPGAAGWGLIALFSALPSVAGQLWRVIRRDAHPARVEKSPGGAEVAAVSN